MTDMRPETSPAPRRRWTRETALRSVAAFPWEQTLIMGVAAVIGVYAGIAAGLFSNCIRTTQILLFRFPELTAHLRDPGWQARFFARLRAAPWRLEFAVLAAIALAASFALSLRSRRIVPAFEAARIRPVALAGAFGLALYYPLLVIATFNETFSEAENGLYGILVSTPIWLQIAGPALGGLAAGLIVRYVSPESGGHGVIEVMEAVHGRTMNLPGRVAVWKSVAAGLTIGSGGSAGREGPVVHLGGAVGSVLSKVLALPRDRRALLLACGAGAGIAASFHAPLAGAMFAIEIVLAGEFSVRGFAPIVLSAVTAVVASRSLVAGQGDLHDVEWQLTSGLEIGMYVILGFAAGAVALAYVRIIALVHDVFDGHRLRRLRLWKLPASLKPAAGGLLLGICALEAPRALGTGIESMNAALAGELGLLTLLLTLAVKLIGTGLTLGSGAPGGSFFPAVFCGAMAGGAFGRIAHHFFPAIAAVPEAYAAVGMGAVVAGSATAPLTGVLMMFELTGDYQIVLPLLVSCGIAAAFVHRALGGSMYSLQLRARGVRFSAREKVLQALSVEQAMEKVDPIPESLGWSDLVRLVSDTAFPAYPVGGILSVREVRAALLDPELAQIAVAGDLSRKEPPVVRMDDDLDSALQKLAGAGVTSAVVVSAEEIPLGIITRENILEAWRHATEPAT
ncbi:MAG: chloride channel protein [Deltaproteobacteria bacterium]|nr:MAG: chloride channel protein [Deltaproteobacteria bacterium]